jgi:hypothetical protein
MTLVRVSIIQGVTALPLNRNLVPRFTNEGEHKKTMKDALIVEIREYWTAEQNKTSRSNNFIGYPGWRRTVSTSNAEADTFHWSKNF